MYSADYGRYDKSFVSLNSFSDVEKLYKNITPVNERVVGTRRDIRPISERKRKYERVHKFSDNCYGLFEGGIGDPYGWMANHVIAKKNDAKIFAPILWTRSKSGRERLRIRNETGEGQHTGRYGFLQFALPNSMDLLIQNGKQFVGYCNDTYYLPKGKRVPGDGSTMKKWWRGSYQCTPDHVELTFERVPTKVGYETIGHQFILVGEPHQLPRMLVDKETKRKHKDTIDSFWEWLCAIAPMLPVHDWDYVRNSTEELRGYIAGFSETESIRWGSNQMVIPANVALRIMTDYDNSQRLNMAVNFLSSASYHYTTPSSQGLDIQTAEDKKQFRANYNRWINRTLDLVKVG